ncbi:amidohydrolase [Ophiocordyceps camponoti-floridani]|uniref:Amidohydrolase n=1 Tax=Ophiocordyceps camponoti-floridani TaxID=2030778 RepID=A0A8H4QBG3_9HYPO|nr:amidohydrolase [Ophiocordyceps camponoti-floridani]
MQTRMIHAALLLLWTRQVTQAKTFTIKDITVVDVKAGDLLARKNIVVEDNKILSIDDAKNSTRHTDGDINGRGKFAIPGLSDMHVHVFFSNDPASFEVGNNLTMPLFVANGVTTVRDLGSNLKAIKSARDDVEQHKLVGPRVFFTGPMLDGPNSPFETTIRLATPAEARREVKNLKDSGVDYIKVHLKLSRSVFDEVARACKAENITFGGHVPDSITAQHAVNMGMGFIEHMSRLDDIDSDGDLKETMRDKEIWQCPTLKLGPAARRFNLTKTLFDAKVPMVAGTDSPAGQNLCPGFSLLDELQLMNEAGLSELETLQTATVNASSSLGSKGLMMGTIEVGKLADIVLLDENPLDDIRNVRSISTVIADGRVFSKKEIDKMLTGADRLSQCVEQRGTRAARDLVSAGPSCCSA